MDGGKGRTLWEILTGKNGQALELQHYNPLAARVGTKISLDHDPALSGVFFSVEKISAYETSVGPKKFRHTDYHLKALTLDREHPVRFQLRLVPDESPRNRTGCRILALQLYDTLEWDADFHANVLCNESGVFQVNHDDEGGELTTPRIYWRVEGVIDPYGARVTVLADKDGDGTVEPEEMEQHRVIYWDYHRLTDGPAGEFLEHLVIEMNEKTRMFTFLRGGDVEPFQVTVL